MKQDIEHGLGGLKLKELLQQQGRGAAAVLGLARKKGRLLVQIRVVAPNKGVVASSLSGAGIGVFEPREVKRQASDPLDGRDMAAEDAMNKHEALERHHPAAGLVHAGRQPPSQRLQVNGRGPDPLEHTPGVPVVDPGRVVARGSDDRGLQVRVPVGGAAGQAGQPYAIFVFDSSGSLPPQLHSSAHAHPM